LPSDKKLPIFVFLWEGDSSLSPFGWDRAKSNADNAGHDLADVIAESKSACPDDKIRLIAHPLGSRVVLSALDSLERNTRWK
jgi:esterase/lipase superfamily enzyme